MYRDYVILAITLLVIAFIFAGIRVRRYNLPYLYYMAAIVLSAFFFTDPTLVGDRFINWMYPLFVPILFIIGPGLYGSIQPVENRRTPWHIIHYLPMIIGYLMIFLHWFLATDDYYNSVQSGRHFEFTNNRMFYPFTDKFILMGYPIFSAGYYILSLRKLKEQNSPRNMYLLPIGLLISTPIIFDLVHDYVYGYGLLIKNPEAQRYLMLGTVLVIFWDVIIVKPPKPAELSDTSGAHNSSLFNYPSPEGEDNAMIDFIRAFSTNTEESLDNILSSKNRFISSSPFKEGEWNQFFAETHTNWNFLKKYIRIKRALFLMTNGYLENNTIDDLARNIGYETRASLYLAFKQIVGKSLPEYRKDSI